MFNFKLHSPNSPENVEESSTDFKPSLIQSPTPTTPTCPDRNPPSNQDTTTPDESFPWTLSRPPQEDRTDAASSNHTRVRLPAAPIHYALTFASPGSASSTSTYSHLRLLLPVRPSGVLLRALRHAASFACFLHRRIRGTKGRGRAGGCEGGREGSRQADGC